nr:uncharacterized protein LOC128703022 [Cherax quadricarinatus]XP_053653557.1 uncharacterized protein LOC128703022 [Cherax quadricarinatus]XP_053653563.1 uncharacterized protein LOC128703022 [Cherax quadricarinatus]
MNWRDRISILSRKRKHGRAGPPLNGQNDLPSGSGIISNHSLASNSAPVESVENTLSQLRPVIGPDHKSYYILLRGDEDSFTCIQPARDVVNSLDEVLKNVISTLKLVKPPLQATELPPNAKKPRYSQGKTYTTTVVHRHVDSVRKNGIHNTGSTLLNEDKIESSVNVGNLLLDKACNTSSSTNSIVENVILNRTVQNLGSDQHNQMVRTSTLMYPLVQSRLKSNGTVNVNTKQDSCLFISSDSESENVSNSLITPVSENDLIQNTTSSASSLRKKDCKGRQTHVLNAGENNVTPAPMTEFIRPAGSSTRGLECTIATIEHNSPMTELSLIAKEGTVLTEEEITSQIKTLIESEQLVVGEDNQIVVIRVSAREAMVKIVLNESEVDVLVRRHQETGAVTKSTRSKQSAIKKEVKVEVDDPLSLPIAVVDGECYNPEAMVNQEYLLSQCSQTQQSAIKEEIKIEVDDTLSLPISAVADGDCYNPEAMVNQEYLLSQCSQTQQDFYDGKEIMDPRLEKTVDPDCVVDSLVNPLVSSLPSEQQQAEVLERLEDDSGMETLSDALINATEGGEIVVFQREDGAFVNQDGTPVSSEIQYLITSLQQDFTPSLDAEDQAHNILLPPDNFEHNTIDVNSAL